MLVHEFLSANSANRKSDFAEVFRRSSWRILAVAINATVINPGKYWSSFLSSFSDPEAVSRYAEGPVRLVPGFHALQQMAALLLAESVGDDSRVLVVGSGGGLELKIFPFAPIEII